MSQTVAILGANLCGWMAAAALARRLPRDRYSVVVIDDGTTGDGLGDFAPVIAVPPALGGFHADLGIEPTALVRATGGSHALGVAFGGWRKDGAAAFLSYGETGAPLQGIAFHQLAGRLRKDGIHVRLADYAVSAVAAQVGRFALEAPIAHALHLLVDPYTAVLRAAAMNFGASCTNAPFADAQIDASGIVETLKLADGTDIAPLLVLDCSGSSARIASRTAPAFEDWSAWLPCDRTYTQTLPATGAPPPYTQVDAQGSGWTATWPLGGADVRLTCAASGEGTPFRAGRRVEAWRGNCIAMGAAAGLIEPLHPTALTVLLRSLAQLIQLWPAERRAPVEAKAFNRFTANAMTGARDFVIAQKAAARGSNAIGDVRSEPVLPDAIEAKRTLFAARGRLPMFDDEPFEEEDWAAMFDAMGLVPRRYDARADALPLATIQQHFADHRARIIAQVRALPPYAHAMAELAAA
ncbi:tryptophan halogenase [Sphingomonas faeni]|uniref:Tryptophan halogenase n=1 Tax=Sphingomonas faeni TaxID=185950 RepID=A0A2T5UCG3_9SPHN|nr:tryptophan 7-halogenase [Sphingomonas faeni]PTW49154.1 tryptophan halogenase [Sphingomonas faeni]